MKTIGKHVVRVSLLVLICLQLIMHQAGAQISMVCTDPTNTIYGLTQAGTIYPINVNTAVCGAATKNGTYLGNSPAFSNALGYNPVNGRFYYFKRNVVSGAPQEFVSFNPLTGLVTILASSPFLSETHTGAVNVNGQGYYAIDIFGRLGYYDIAANSWTQITNSMVDQFGNNVTEVIQSQYAGDIAIDGYGNLWIVTSNATNFGVYRLQGPLPTTPQGQLTVTQRLAPTTATPSGNLIAGIAFNPSGQIYLSTKNDNRLYILENNLTTTFRGTFTVSDVGNDLTSCNFPIMVLPVKWNSFSALVKANTEVEINWSVLENQSAGYYIEHSTDGANWSNVSYIESTGAINNNYNNYGYLFRNASEGRNFFRIRQVDLDGSTSYSEVRSVMIRKDGVTTFSVFPNPASGQINVEYNSSVGALGLSAVIYDIAGRQLITKNISTGITTINVQTLSPGVYYMKILGTGIHAETRKFVLQ